MGNCLKKKRKSNLSENETEKTIVSKEVRAPNLFNQDDEDDVEGFIQDNNDEDEKIATTSATNLKTTITGL